MKVWGGTVSRVRLVLGIMFMTIGTLHVCARFSWAGFVPRFQPQLECFANAVVFLLALLVTTGRW